MKTLFLVLSLALCSARAEAAEPLTRGLAVGLGSVGGEVLGAAGGAVAGYGLGLAACELSNAWECYMAPFGAVAVGGLGGIGGAGAGGATVARWVGAKPGRVFGFSMLGALGGLAVSGLGAATGADGLATAGLYVGAIGMPVMAGLGAATGEEVPRARATVSLSPQVGPRFQGVSLSATW